MTLYEQYVEYMVGISKLGMVFFVKSLFIRRASGAGGGQGQKGNLPPLAAKILPIFSF